LILQTRAKKNIMKLSKPETIALPKATPIPPPPPPPSARVCGDGGAERRERLDWGGGAGDGNLAFDAGEVIWVFNRFCLRDSEAKGDLLELDLGGHVAFITTEDAAGLQHRILGGDVGVVVAKRSGDALRGIAYVADLTIEEPKPEEKKP